MTLRSSDSDLASGAVEESLALLRPQLSREPANAQLWHQVAILAQQVQRSPEAVAAATQAVLLAPACIEYRLTLAAALHLDADLARAITQFEIAARLAPDDLRAALGLASVYAAVGLFDEGAGADRTALKIDPANRAAAQRLFDEAVRLEKAGQPAQALKVFALAARKVAWIGADTLSNWVSAAGRRPG